MRVSPFTVVKSKVHNAPVFLVQPHRKFAQQLDLIRGVQLNGQSNFILTSDGRIFTGLHGLSHVPERAPITLETDYFGMHKILGSSVRKGHALANIVQGRSAAVRSCCDRRFSLASLYRLSGTVINRHVTPLLFLSLFLVEDQEPHDSHSES